MDSIQEATFLALNGQLGWRSEHSTGISMGRDALCLDADPHGPLGLTWRDGSLGGLCLPRGFAMDQQHRVYLLTPHTPWAISRFELAMQAFVPLPGIGGAGYEARQFQQPGNLAIAQQLLYVADSGNQRVQVFDLPTLALLYVWEAPTTQSWYPSDIAASGTNAYVLDSHNQRVYRHCVGLDTLELFIDGHAQAGKWERIAVDQAGHVYILDLANARPCLLPYDRHGQRELERQANGTLLARIIEDAAAIRDRFEPPALRLLYDQRTQREYFCLPASLSVPCQPELPTQPPTPESPLLLCQPLATQSDPAQHGMIFDRGGQPAQPDPSALIAVALYQTEGEWFSQALDSTIYRCQWHRIELELNPLPPGTQIEIATYSADESWHTLPPADSPLWQAGYRAIGQIQPPLSHAEPAPNDCLVQSRQGQYLWLKIKLGSDGFATPTLRGIRLHFPRESYLTYLPAVFSAEDTSRHFLERYLSLFQTDWDDLERQIIRSIALFDPDAVPAGPFLGELANRFGLAHEDDWSIEQRRSLLQAMPAFYTRRGSAAGLRAYLQAYLQNMSGLKPAEQGDYPILIESWRERRRLELGTTDTQITQPRAPLWGPAMLGRLQIGSYARLGEARLVETGDPQRDIFQHYANRFKLYVPAAWVGSAANERMLRRAVEAEKPAHIAYELHLVEGRFRIGVQSTIGLDTILGDIPTLRLACGTAHQGEQQDTDEQPAPSRAPRQRLGYDSVLSAGRVRREVLPLALE